MSKGRCSHAKLILKIPGIFIWRAAYRAICSSPAAPIPVPHVGAASPSSLPIPPPWGPTWLLLCARTAAAAEEHAEVVDAADGLGALGGVA